MSNVVNRRRQIPVFSEERDLSYRVDPRTGQPIKDDKGSSMRANAVGRGKPIVTRTMSDEYYSGEEYSYQIELNQFITTMSHEQMEQFAVDVCQMLGWVAMPNAFSPSSRESDQIKALKTEMAQMDLQFRDQMSEFRKEIAAERRSMREAMDSVKKGAESALKELEKMLESQRVQDSLTGSGSGRRLQIDEG